MASTTYAEYLSIGGNRNTAASAWSAETGILAYGADVNVALWCPFGNDASGVQALLRGHHAKVTAVNFLHSPQGSCLISGDAEGELIVWQHNGEQNSWDITTTIDAHNGATNVIATLNGSQLLASGGADAVIKIWRIHVGKLNPVSTITTKPRYIPLALAIGRLPNTSPAEACFVAGAGTRNDISIYAIDTTSNDSKTDRQISLTGHEGWIHCLALTQDDAGGYLLASVSSDKYVRLWQFLEGEAHDRKNGAERQSIASLEPTLNAKVKSVAFGAVKYSVTFEALLLGHEDWVYSAAWQKSKDRKLLTASADGTLAIWEPDPTSGIWVSETRLGEISGQKGATTATGSSGGFWKALWLERSGFEDAAMLTCLGRTGSWRMWEHDLSTEFWRSRPGISGHVASVNGLSWSRDGSFLLSSGSDQTTRLHAEWRRSKKRTWHEFSRPQIHGYDLNCIACTGSHQFTSGADEKLLRVFDAPRELAQALEQLCDIRCEDLLHPLPESAAIPVLGLSNKAQGEPDDILEAGPHRKNDSDYAPTYSAEIPVSELQEPPTEDLLSRHTLWPEVEKLYGHGYEINECAYSSENNVLATSCKASSLDHAVIRLYDTSSPEWREMKPPLTAHSLTVTRLAWSQNHLLSVGRDRQWTLFCLTNDEKLERKLEVLQVMPKAHTRMILDCAMGHTRSHLLFATAGRDRTIKLWSNAAKEPDSVDGLSSTQRPAIYLCQTVVRSNAVTAIDLKSSESRDSIFLAAGEEDGTISIHVFDVRKALQLVRSIDLSPACCPSKPITRLLWRPETSRYVDDGKGSLLAIASADSSVRILRVDVEALH